MSDVIGTAKIVTEVDSSGVEVGVNKAKRSLVDLGVTASTAGKKASDGLNEMGKGGDQAAQKVDSATKNMIGSIQRQIAVLEAGSKSSSKYYEAIAAQRGVDVNTLKPYLAQLDAAASKQTQAGMSAAQMANNLRMVGPQVTDIVTSLQGGQKPLTVFIQQGGQLKDMFGGVGPAAKALGGYVAGLINPFTLAALGAGALAYAYSQGSKEADAYAKALILSGNAAGTTASQLQGMAKRIDGVTGTQAAAAEALAQFAGSGNVAAQSLEKFAAIALRMERETGQAVSETVKQFSELAKSPVDASVKLNETTNYLTASIYQQIKALEDQGKTADAAALAQKTYADALDSRLAQINGHLGFIERAWRGVTGAAKDAWDAMLNVGRQDTGADKLSGISDAIAASREKINRLSKLGSGKDTQLAISAEQSRLNAMLQQQSILQENGRLEVRSAASQREAAEQAKARIAFEKDGEKFLSSRAKLEQEIAKARAQGAAAGASQAEIEKRVADIRASHKDLTSAGLQIDKAKLGLDIEAIKSANEALTGNYTNAEKIMESVHAAGIMSDREYYEAKREFIRLQTEAGERELQSEIARYQQEKLTGKDKLENDKKIAETQAKLATLRASSTANLVVLSNQEEAAAKRLQLSYLTARQAAQDYFDTQLRQQQRSIAGIGQGTQQRSFDSGVSQIEDRYASQRRDLENTKAQLELEGKFTADARAQYEERLSIINEFQAKSIASYASYYDELMKKQGDWVLGAQEGLKNYLDDSRNTFKQTEKLVGDAFGGMEDALVNFVKTGKLDFHSLADSIISDMVRMAIKQNITGPLSGGLSSLFGGMSSLFGGGFGAFGVMNSGVAASTGLSMADLAGAFADGGDPPVGKVSLVGERGPELFVPKSAGTIIPNEKLGGNSTRINYAPVIQVDSRADRVQVQQDVQRQIQAGNAQLVEQLKRARVL